MFRILFGYLRLRDPESIHILAYPNIRAGSACVTTTITTLIVLNDSNVKFPQDTGEPRDTSNPELKYYRLISPTSSSFDERHVTFAHCILIRSVPACSE